MLNLQKMSLFENLPHLAHFDVMIYQLVSMGDDLFHYFGQVQPLPCIIKKIPGL